jgi:hypothetical protein
MTDDTKPRKNEDEIARRILEAGERARAEADARRKASPEKPRPKEVQGRGGPDPARFGDWEVKGVASDF